MKIIKGKKSRPRRIVLYGTHGIGKSTWATHAPAPIFISTEDGLDDIGCDRTPLIKSLSAFNEAVSYLIGNPHDYSTVVVDTADWLERLIWRAVAQENNKSSIDDIAYYRGYNLAIRHWDFILSSLEELRQSRNVAVILLAHAKSTKIEPPDGESYSRYEPDLHKNVSPLLQEWADEVLFASYKINRIKKGEGFNERFQAIGDGERVVYTCEKPTHLAKRRIQMPDEIPLDWNTYLEHIKQSYASKPADNINGIVVDGSSKPKKETADYGLAKWVHCERGRAGVIRHDTGGQLRGGDHR